ncbi:MAG: hypothetical protein HOW97_26460, partial [Catenulispora sp.]|nr:hypothetical protein [Catenulispora sp.]
MREPGGGERRDRYDRGAGRPGELGEHGRLLGVEHGERPERDPEQRGEHHGRPGPGDVHGRPGVLGAVDR